MSSSLAKSKDYKLEIMDLNPVDLCGKEYEREIIIAPTIGSVIKSDSLIGFELSLNYNPEVVKINRVLTINTFADRFKYKKSNADGENGEIVFEGAVDLKGFPNPLSGDMPLVGFAGDFIGTCNDTAVIGVNYFFPFDDFKGSVDADTTLKIAGKIVDKPSRSIGFEIEDSEIILKQDSSVSLNVNLDLGELSSLEFWQVRFSLDTDSISIESIEGNNSINIDNVTPNGDNGYLVDMEVLNIENTDIMLQIKSHKYDTADVNLKIETVNTTECVCATRFPDSDYTFTNMQSKDSVSTNVDYFVEYDNVNGIIIPKTEALNIQVYNVLGNKIDEKYCDVNNVYDTNRLKEGIYFIKVTTSNNTKIYKKINN
jgi:hypothetical protein